MDGYGPMRPLCYGNSSHCRSIQKLTKLRDEGLSLVTGQIIDQINIDPLSSIPTPALNAVLLQQMKELAKFVAEILAAPNIEEKCFYNSNSCRS